MFKGRFRHFFVSVSVVVRIGIVTHVLKDLSVLCLGDCPAGVLRSVRVKCFRCCCGQFMWMKFPCNSLCDLTVIPAL